MHLVTVYVLDHSLAPSIMSQSLLIKNATASLPSGRSLTNLLVEDGKIVSLDAAPTTIVKEVVDATGLILFPGLIDDQVHFREPGLTHKEDLHTASRACAAGGVTSFLEMPNTKPAAINQSLIEDKYRLAGCGGFQGSELGFGIHF